MTRPHAGEQGGGAISAPMAVALIAMLVAVGLGVDGVRAAQGLATADAVAEEAARAAGQALDRAQLRRGTATVDRGAAVVAAQDHLAASGATGQVTVLAAQRIRVEARITRPTVLLGLVGLTEITSTGTAEALLIAVPPAGEPT